MADWWAESPESQGGPKLLLVFDGGQLDNELLAAVKLDGREIQAIELCEVAGLPARTIPRLANRLEIALSVRQAKRPTTYLENGLSIDGS